MIKVSRLAEKVREIGQANPAVIYEEVVEELTGEPFEGGCLYQMYNAPSCLVGQALHELGVRVSQLREFDSHPCGDTGIDSIISQYPDMFDRDDDDSLLFLTKAQRSQDFGTPWGDAVNL